jgi:hypothetical protein
MALLPTTGLENHPVGTTGLNGIINGNWEKLEAIFLPLAAATPGGRIQWDPTAKKFSLRPALAVLAYSATPTWSLAGAVTQTLALTGNVTIATSNLTAGAEGKLLITADGTLRTLTFPAGWVFLGGAAPANIAASKKGLLEILSTTTADSGVVARWTVQP